MSIVKKPFGKLPCGCEADLYIMTNASGASVEITNFGGIINLKAPGFNFYVATDCMPGKLAKQYAPLNSNLNVNLGINFPF